MTSFLLTLGFDTTPITKCLVRENVEDGDKVIILRPSGERDDRSEQAIKDVEDFLAKIGEIDLDIKNLHPATPYKSVAEIITLIGNIDDKNVVGITGGGRELIFPFVISIILKSDKIDEFYMFSDVDRRLRHFDIPSLLFQPDEKDLRILESTERYKKMQELSEELDLSQSTISRRCSKLEANKLLESKKKGKYKFFKITVSGQIIFKVHKEA